MEGSSLSLEEQCGYLMSQVRQFDSSVRARFEEAWTAECGRLDALIAQREAELLQLEQDFARKQDVLRQAIFQGAAK